MDLTVRIEEAISEHIGSRVHIVNSTIAHGGCINHSQIIQFNDGSQFFLKTHGDAGQYPDMFAAEFKALSLISASNSIRVPEPILFQDDFIVMEYFREGVRAADWYEMTGQQLAAMHQQTKTDEFGFQRNNYLGTSLQPNLKSKSWLAFWSGQRLGFQLGILSQKISKDDPLLSLAYKLLEKLDDIIVEDNEPAVLLHGDLWSGNASADEQGQPIIFDPASYYGHREAEFGMMRLFGGFGSRVEAAYEEIWPFQDGADRRITLYRLYHELNHLNLFGKTYYSACLSTVKSLL